MLVSQINKRHNTTINFAAIQFGAEQLFGISRIESQLLTARGGFVLDAGSSMVGPNISSISLVDLKSRNPFFMQNHPRSSLCTAFTLAKLIPIQLTFSQVLRPLSVRKFKKMSWSLRSAADDNRLNSFPTNESSGGTRLIRTIKAIRLKIIARLKELMNNLPVKLFSFLVGFYCATAFATVIGQTGDWDVLSAALTVAVVEGIGALMYKSSFTLVNNKSVQWPAFLTTSEEAGKRRRRPGLEVGGVGGGAPSPS